ncbi:hypothetical protein B739_0142 [Riemerella anatipestifer RA-CH-1]|uniref:Uncharacterized protein n=2 Tax=Riemerella anatipestifer TaxID=34085 RepID=J9QX98_RIEAN|nr:hypothetical protein B739_0142 [Riemerella anatipestifer RA-CH-1]AIH01748.1 hypothetical protein M949_0577 [Riemerella anatipestifer CH3]AQY22581.1 hypothetical protein AB406_1637 [Riemerella anatipestifer]
MLLINSIAFFISKQQKRATLKSSSFAIIIEHFKDYSI